MIHEWNLKSVVCFWIQKSMRRKTIFHFCYFCLHIWRQKCFST